MLGEIYFRLETDYIMHIRVVYSFFDWLESIGDVPEILKSISTFIIGAWLSFHATFINLKYLYYLQTKKIIFD